MSLKDFYVVSGDTHIIEPADLFKTRLPKNLRDRALWEEEFTLEEPVVPGGHTEFKKLHTIGFDGWTVSKYRQFGGPTPDGDPANIIRDMDLEGVDASRITNAFRAATSIACSRVGAIAARRSRASRM